MGFATLLTHLERCLSLHTGEFLNVYYVASTVVNLLSISSNAASAFAGDNTGPSNLSKSAKALQYLIFYSEFIIALFLVIVASFFWWKVHSDFECLLDCVSFDCVLLCRSIFDLVQFMRCRVVFVSDDSLSALIVQN
jgi:hypothetical protein